MQWSVVSLCPQLQSNHDGGKARNLKKKRGIMEYSGRKGIRSLTLPKYQ